MKDKDVMLLRMAVEHGVDFKVATPRGFERLSCIIQNRTRENLSVSTLKRLWEYVRGYESIRPSTLDVLSRFLGYEDYEHFRQRIQSEEDIKASNFFLGECICTDDVHVGDILRLTWSPGRRCDIRYEGDKRFTVIDSVVTRLVPGTTFCCYLIEKGQPLYINKVIFPSSPDEEYNYCAGRNGGVWFESAPTYC